jgi:hypothetical protein
MEDVSQSNKNLDLDLFKETTNLSELVSAFDEIQMARTPYVLEKMVVGSKFTEEQRYAQCVCELSIAYDNLRTAKCGARLKEIEIEENKEEGEKGELEREKLQIELDQLNRARLGAYREFMTLYAIWQKFPKRYTREELNEAQEREYKMRLAIQAEQDRNATGRISQGNQEGLRQLGMSNAYPNLDIERDVERRFLETGKVRMMVAVATEEKAINGLPCLEGLEFPNGVEIKIFNSYGRSIADNYNNIVEEALKDNATYLVTVEDDTFPQKDAIIKLLDTLKENPKSAVGAWYPKREASLQGVHIVLKDGERSQLKPDNRVHEVFTLSMGCSIYPVEMFKEIPFPWFKTTAHLSQDSFFSQLAREAGYKLLVDTSVRAKHVDRNTGTAYFFDGVMGSDGIPTGKGWADGTPSDNNKPEDPESFYKELLNK